MIGAPFAHIGGIPIEETLGSLGPALLVAFGVAWAQLRARVRFRASAPVRRRRAVQADRSDLASSDVERPSGRETTARRRRRHDPRASASAQSSRQRCVASEDEEQASAGAIVGSALAAASVEEQQRGVRSRSPATEQPAPAERAPRTHVEQRSTHALAL
jgi:FtsZ-interacting cell division protein ZipA